MERSGQNTASMLWRNPCIAGKTFYHLPNPPSPKWIKVLEGEETNTLQ